MTSDPRKQRYLSANNNSESSHTKLSPMLVAPSIPARQSSRASRFSPIENVDLTLSSHVSNHPSDQPTPHPEPDKTQTDFETKVEPQHTAVKVVPDHDMPQSKSEQSGHQDLGSLLTKLISVAGTVNRAEEDSGKLEEQLDILRREELEFSMKYPEHKVVIEDLSRRRKLAEEALAASRKTLVRERPEREDACQAVLSVLVATVKASFANASAATSSIISEPPFKHKDPQQSSSGPSIDLEATDKRLSALEQDTKEALSKCGQVSYCQALSQEAKRMATSAGTQAEETRGLVKTTQAQAYKALDAADDALAEAKKANAAKSQADKALERASEALAEATKVSIDTKKAQNSLKSLEEKLTTQVKTQEAHLHNVNSRIEIITSKLAEVDKLSLDDSSAKVKEIEAGLREMQEDYVSKEKFKAGFEEFLTLKQAMETRFKELETVALQMSSGQQDASIRAQVEPLLGRLTSLETHAKQEQRKADNDRAITQKQVADTVQAQLDLKAQVSALRTQVQTGMLQSKLTPETNVALHSPRMNGDPARKLSQNGISATGSETSGLQKKVEYVESRMKGFDTTIRVLSHQYNNISTESLARNMLVQLDSRLPRFDKDMSKLKTDVLDRQNVEIELRTKIEEQEAAVEALRQTQTALHVTYANKDEFKQEIEELTESIKERHEKLVENVKDEKANLKQQIHELQAIVQKHKPVLKTLRSDMAVVTEAWNGFGGRMTELETKQQSQARALKLQSVEVDRSRGKDISSKEVISKSIESRGSSRASSSSTSSKVATPIVQQKKKQNHTLAKGSPLSVELDSNASSPDNLSNEVQMDEVAPSSKKKSGTPSSTKSQNKDAVKSNNMPRFSYLYDGPTSTPGSSTSTQRPEDDDTPRASQRSKKPPKPLIGEPESVSSTPPSAQKPTTDLTYLDGWINPASKSKTSNPLSRIENDEDTIEVDQSQSPEASADVIVDIPAKRRLSPADENYAPARPKRKKKVSFAG